MKHVTPNKSAALSVIVENKHALLLLQEAGATD